MKQLLHHARQLNQRRMSAFYLLPEPGVSNASSRSGQLPLQHIPPPDDRPRSLREMFADTEYDSDDDA